MPEERDEKTFGRRRRMVALLVARNSIEDPVGTLQLRVMAAVNDRFTSCATAASSSSSSPFSL